MNDLDKALSDLITKSIEGMEKAGDFIVGELPLFVSELLMIKGATHIVLFLFSVLACVFFFNFRDRVISNDEIWRHDRQFASVFLLGLIGLISLFSMYQLIQGLTVFMAPRVYLFEYASKLVAS